MTKKDHALIATALAKSKPIKGTKAYDTWMTTCENIALACLKDNSIFSMSKFLTLCLK